MLGASRRSSDRRRSYTASAIFWDYYAGCTDCAGSAQNRAGVLRILKMIQHQHQRILVGFDFRKKFFETHIRITGRLQRNALVVAKARKLVKLSALGSANDEPATGSLLANHLELIVLVWGRRRHDDFHRRAPSCGQSFFDRVSAVDPLSAGHEFSRPFVARVIFVVAHRQFVLLVKLLNSRRIRRRPEA